MYPNLNDMFSMIKVHPVLVLLTLHFMSMIVLALPSKRSTHQVKPSPPIELGNGQSPNPGGFLPVHHNPTQCLFVCSTDPRCQQMNFEKSNDGACACACQICQGQWYGSISDYTKSTPLTPAEMARCPNFIYGNL